MTRILIGAFLLCFYIGYLVGSSASATAGIVSAILVGVVVATAPLVYARLRAKGDGSVPSLAWDTGLGTLLIACAIGLIGGTAFGTIVRFIYWGATYPMSMGTPPLG